MFQLETRALSAQVRLFLKLTGIALVYLGIAATFTSVALIVWVISLLIS